MSLTGNQLVNDVYFASDVSAGNATQNGNGTYSYSSTQQLATATAPGFGTLFGPNAKFTVTSGIANTVTVTVSNAADALLDGQTFVGTIVGNDARDLLLLGVIPGIVGTSYLYVTDSAQSGTVNATVAPLSANVPYSPPCYCAGTLIMTAHGEVAVEELAIGDAVLTKSGAMRPIRWIGRRAYTRRLVAANPSLVPVRIQAGALGGGLPRRDLLVSRRHAMFIDGVLVPASALVNGGTIAAADPDAVEYFHIELDEHDVIQAEGAWSETFIDDDSRFAFHNAAEYEALYPGRVPVQAEFCAPVIEHGPVLQAIRDRINGVVSRTLSLQADAAPDAMMLAMLGAGPDQRFSAL